jgi:hypothetical protein
MHPKSGFRCNFPVPWAFWEISAQRWCNMPRSHLGQLKTAEYLRQQATNYRALARLISDEHAVAIMESMARDFDERAFEIMYAVQAIIRHDRAA